MNSPFFSIIVVSYNAKDVIRATIESILMQQFGDYEIIVKDACSSDGTVEMIPQDERIRLYITKDSGIYDGMNEAITYASGQYLCFLNCGDVFASDDVLGKVYESVRQCTDTNKLLYGDCIRKDGLCRQPDKMTNFYLYRTPLNHQSMFFGKEALARWGTYDTKYRISADYDCTVRMFKKGVEFIHCPVIVCRYQGGGVSESEKGLKIMKAEAAQIRNEHFSLSEKKRYDLMLMLSLPGFRRKLVSTKSPKWIRKLYRRLVNLMNR